MHFTASTFPFWHRVSLTQQRMQWLPSLLYYAPLQAAASGVKSALWVSSHPGPAPLPLPHHQMPLGQPSLTPQTPARLKSAWNGPWTSWQIRLAPKSRRQMKTYGDTFFPLYFPHILKLLGVSPAPQQLSEPSWARPLSIDSHETFLILLRDHTWALLYQCCQISFLIFQVKTVFPLPLTWVCV